jgi:streptomycin 3"-adenylyltransferase
MAGLPKGEGALALQAGVTIAGRMTAPVPTELAGQLARARAVLERHLAGTLEAIHLFGSAVDGGLQPLSDIDLLVTVGAPPAEPVRRALMLALLAVSAPPGASASLRPLEVTVLVRGEVVPWRHAPRRELQFGEWLREDLQKGIVEPAMPDHDLAILLTKARQHSICLLGLPADRLFDPVPAGDFARALADTVAQWNEPADWEGDERNVVLALARIWFSAATGGIAPKDAAAAWVLERLPAAHRPVLARARAAYRGEAQDDLAARPDAVAAFVRHAKAAIGRLQLARSA